MLFEVYGIADYTNRIEIGFGMFFWFLGLLGFMCFLDCRPHTPMSFGFFWVLGVLGVFGLSTPHSSDLWVFFVVFEFCGFWGLGIWSRGWLGCGPVGFEGPAG